MPILRHTAYSLIKKAIDKLVVFLQIIGFYRLAVKLVSSCEVIGWRQTPLALKPKTHWNVRSPAESMLFHEICELASLATHSLKLPPIAFSEEMAQTRREAIEDKFRHYQSVEDHAMKVVTGCHKRVASDGRDILIITAGGHPVDGLCVAMNGADFLRDRLIWPRVKRLPGRTLMCSAAMGEGNYYHWCLEVLPRIGAVLQSGMKWDDFDQLLIRNKGLTFQTESFQAIGCPVDKLIRENGCVCFDCDELTTTTHPANYIPSEFAINYLSGPFADAVKSQTAQTLQQPCSEKIYISRLGSRRELANESEVIQVLLEKGFSIINLEKLSLQSQIRLFEGARIVVAAHGAGMTNLVFCKPDTRVIEIFHPNHVETMYWGISEMKSLDYTPFCLASHQEHMPISRLLMLASQTN